MVVGLWWNCWFFNLYSFLSYKTKDTKCPKLLRGNGDVTVVSLVAAALIELEIQVV